MAAAENGGQRPDVLVVGAGAAGSVVAARAASAGLSVVCLEQGDYPARSDYPGDKPEGELLARKQWHTDPHVRRAPQDCPADTSESDIDPQTYSGVGGSTVLYAAHWMRFLPSDFRVRSLDGVADDWPLSYDDLVPSYEALEAQMGVSGLAGDPAYPPGVAPPLPPHAMNAVSRKVAEGMNRLGWHWWPGTNAIPTRAHRNQRACARHGTCMSGCPEGAKGSTDVTHWPLALRHGAKLITGARVREITTNAKGLATGAVYVDRRGVEHYQPASTVVLAANAIGTARLLLLSAPDGLANSSGLVGKRLMFHPFANVVGFFDEDLAAWHGPFGQYLYSLEFYETDAGRGFVRGAKWGLMPMGGPLAAVGPSTPYGDGFHAAVRRQGGRSAQWGIISEDLPDERNAVTLAPHLTDSDGIPAPKLTYRIDGNSRRLLDFHVARAREAFEAAGAYATAAEMPVRASGWHLMGTARMGEDPATSVVDADGRAHDVPNLFVCDGSVFVTSAGVNPAATICAIARRCADRLVRNAPSQAVPA